MIVISHFHGNKQDIIISKKQRSIKEIKTLILKRLQKNKDSYIKFNDYKFWLEDQYIYPDKETEYMYCEIPDYMTGLKLVVIVKDKNIIKLEKQDFINNWLP